MQGVTVTCICVCTYTLSALRTQVSGLARLSAEQSGWRWVPVGARRTVPYQYSYECSLLYSYSYRYEYRNDESS